FLRAVKSRRRFRHVKNPVAYMFQVARNEASRAARRRSRMAEQPVEAAELFAIEGDLEDQAADTEIVAAALRRLEARDREIVELKLYGGLAFREIADVTGLPQGTVATCY